MIFLPLSFVAALLIVLLAVRLRRQARAAGPLVPALLATLAALALLQGLRWGYDIRLLTPVQIALALSAPPLTFLAFLRLGEPLRGGDLRHAGAPIAGFLAGAIWPAAYDVAIPAMALIYAGMLARLARRGSDAIPGIRLSEGVLAERALWAGALGLAVSGLTDTAISLDIAWTGGRHAGILVTAAQTFALLLAAGAIAVTGEGAPRPERIERDRQRSASESEQALFARLERLIREHGLYRQPDLTLGRLARRAQVPAKRVSEAVNKVRGESVSRFLNRLRIEDACDRLANSDEPVTQVMLSAGFQTKSNFNRAFKDVMGVGPAEWRQRQRVSQMADQDGRAAAIIRLHGRGNQ